MLLLPVNRLAFALFVFLACPLPGIAAAPNAPAITVASLAELAEAAAKDGQAVRMQPGTYQITDLIPLSAAPARRKAKQFEMFVFSGSDNVFDFEGVTIEVDTALRKALHPPVHTNEFVVSGRKNTLSGLTIVHRGDGSSPGGAALAVTGEGNTLRNCTLHVRGSFPYGYGDLFGKGGSDIIGHRKKSGVLITGNDTAILGCKLRMHSFGHGFFVQKDAANVRFEDCEVEGVMRATDEMLKETSGPAFNVGFRTVAKNREGVARVTPGYMKSLSEDGFRTYGTHKNLSFKNCVAKNMRGGFELRSKTAPRVENCTAVGNERGFWVSDGAQVVNCKGDAQHGPLLFVEGKDASVHVELLRSESPSTVHALATIHGIGHKIAINAAGASGPKKAVPIMIGYGQPMMGEGMAPFPERLARKVKLENYTGMPVVIGAKAEDSEISSKGPVQENLGKNMRITASEGAR